MHCKTCAAEEFRTRSFGLCYSQPERFTKFAFGSPRLYIAWRIFWALWHTALIVASGIYSMNYASEGQSGVKWFIYLTNWGYFILTVDTIVQAICVIYVFVKRRDVVEGLADSMPWYLKVSWVLISVSSNIGIIISLTFWLLLYKPYMTLIVINVTSHAVNSVYILLNLLLSDVPIRLFHVIYPLIYGAIWILFSVAYEMPGGLNRDDKPYIYSILDWSENPGPSAGISLGILFIVVPLVQIIMFFISKVRHCCFGRNSEEYPMKA